MLTFKNPQTYSIVVNCNSKEIQVHAYFQKKNMLILYHGVCFKHWRNHGKQKSNIECNTTKHCNQGRNKKLKIKHLWASEAYYKKKQECFALATFLHYTSYHCISFTAHVIIVICPIGTFKIKSTKTQKQNLILLQYSIFKLILMTNFISKLSLGWW